MFSQISRAFVFALLTFALFAAATGPATTVTVTKTATATAVPASQCNTGPVQCCNSVASSKSGAAGLILGLLNIVLEGVEVLVGLTCVPIIGSVGCSAQAVCCSNNSFHGLIVIGCTPVNLGL